MSTKKHVLLREKPENRKTEKACESEAFLLHPYKERHMTRRGGCYEASGDRSANEGD